MWPSGCANLEDTHLCVGLRAGQQGRAGGAPPADTRVFQAIRPAWKGLRKLCEHGRLVDSSKDCPFFLAES